MTGLLISVIIVNYNTRSMTLRCLETLFQRMEGVATEVFVVDNGSQDGSVVAIQNAFPTVGVVAFDKNLGFGAANNAAMRQARGQYFLLLNSDAFLHAGCLPVLVSQLERNSGVALVGPKLLNEDGSLQQSCWRFPTPLRAWLEGLWITRLSSNHPVFGDYCQWAHDEERDVDFVTGACFLVRREVFEQIGGFDERFFMYSEETDWQRRMKDRGWKVRFDPKATVTHLGGGSGSDALGRTSRIFFNSFDQYFLKHYGQAGFIVMRAAQFVRYSLRALVWSAAAVLFPSKYGGVARLRRELRMLQLQVFSKRSF